MIVLFHNATSKTFAVNSNEVIAIETIDEYILKFYLSSGKILEINLMDYSVKVCYSYELMESYYRITNELKDIDFCECDIDSDCTYNNIEKFIESKKKKQNNVIENYKKFLFLNGLKGCVENTIQDK